MYKCPQCKADVPDNMYHWCGKTEVIDYTEVLTRIATALEKIANAWGKDK
jgi:hypothetical protein